MLVWTLGPAERPWAGAATLGFLIPGVLGGTWRQLSALGGVWRAVIAGAAAGFAASLPVAYAAVLVAALRSTSTWSGRAGRAIGSSPSP